MALGGLEWLLIAILAVGVLFPFVLFAVAYYSDEPADAASDASDAPTEG